MLKFEKSFRTGIIVLLALNILTTVTSMVIIEKTVPMHDEEFNRLIAQQEALMILLLGHDPNEMGASELAQKTRFILNDETSWSDDQKPLILSIKDSLTERDLSSIAEAKSHRYYKKAIEMQKERLRKKLEGFQTTGLAGSWSVGLLSLVSLLFLYVFQHKTARSTLTPFAEILQGIKDWAGGNHQRRLRGLRAEPEVFEAVTSLNDILDLSSPQRLPPNP